MGRKANVLTREFLEERVAKLPDAPGCWLWTRTCNPQGYGTFTVKDKTVPAHRAAYAVFKGEPGDLHVCHRCDTPACINPDHLFLGTAKDNMADKARKGRSAKGDTHGSKTRPERVRRGATHGMAILTEPDVVAIRVSELSDEALAASYGVSVSAIEYARLRGWRHVAVEAVKRAPRSVRGTANPRAKLTDQDVRDIRVSTETLVSCAARYGVHFSLVSRIRKRLAWRHVA